MKMSRKVQKLHEVRVAHAMVSDKKMESGTEMELGDESTSDAPPDTSYLWRKWLAKGSIVSSFWIS